MIGFEPKANAYAEAKSGVPTAQPAPVAAAAEIGKLPGLVKAAAEKLAKAGTAAEVLDARDGAGVIYDAAKRAARMAKAKGAHDQLIAAAHRAQADALEIEAEAKRRLADEYDAAQGRGEVSTRQNNPGSAPHVPDRNMPPATAADIGISRKQVHDARRVRDAEVAAPGVVRESLDAKLAAGEEPTRAALNEAVDRALGKQPASVSPPTDKLQAAWDAASGEERGDFLKRNDLQPVATRSASPAGEEGSPSKPSRSAGGAKSGGVASAPVERAAEVAGLNDAQDRQAFTIPQTARERSLKLRPHCLNPDRCGGYGSTHCGTCLRVAEGKAA